MKYASNTSVSSEKTRGEIERTLTRYGATGFAYGWEAPTAVKGPTAVIMFQMANRRIRFSLPLPDKASKEFTRTPSGRRERGPEEAAREWEQGCRQRWRALALAIKAKLEAVECRISTFDEEFLSHIMLPNGATVGSWMTPQVVRMYESGNMPPMLTGPA